MRRRFYAPQETGFDFLDNFDLVYFSYLIDRPLPGLVEYILTDTLSFPRHFGSTPEGLFDDVL
jgi:hypothetical protein